MCECDCGHHDWDDESAVGDSNYDVRDRKIHPLPKRKRLVDSAPRPQVASVGHGGRAWRSELDSESDEDDIGDVDERHTRSSSSKGPGQEPALDVRTSGEQEYGDGRASYPPRKRTESPASNRRLPRPSGSPPPSALGVLPPTPTGGSPTMSQYLYPDAVDEDGPEEPRDYGLFGEEGYKIAKSLSSASSFSAAGLFGGLGLAALHPATGTGADDRHYVEEDEEEEPEEDGDEDTYGVVDRSRPPVEPTHATTIAATALGAGLSPGGSNKKKRKIPGITATSIPPVTTTVLEMPTRSAIPPPQNRTRAREEEPSPNRGDYSHHPPDNNEWLPKRAPANPPTTAKAALAKLRIRPLHVSLCASCFSTRRHRRKRFKDSAKKQGPFLRLPDAPAFVPPAMPREGPPKLPPGSGLKGSKAVKAAAKLAKEREKEKERIRRLFAGTKVPNLYDPYNVIELPLYVTGMRMEVEVERMFAEMKGNTLKRGTRDKSSPSGYPTPPASSDDDGEDGHAYSWTWESYPPKLDEFDFRRSAPAAIESRWTHLNEQKERVKAAKERAAKAREEEKERKREKEEREKAEKAAAIATAPTPAPTPQRRPQGAPGQQSSHLPSSSTSPPAASRVSPLPPSPPVDYPLTPPPVSALPSPPLANPSLLLPRKTPLKKGRKKRAAHANAHNVHHRDNYIPSRIPAAPAAPPAHHHSQSPMGGGADASLGPTSWPASDEAIAAAGPYASTCGGGHYCDPDEWLCLFCEYRLFYGEEPALYRAMRKRKGVLKVRNKAKDRAMKATQGRSAAEPEAAKQVAGPRRDVAGSSGGAGVSGAEQERAEALEVAGGV